MDHHHHGFDYDKLSEMRQKLIDIKSIINFMNIKHGESIADVGSGDGYYSFLFSPLCSRVYSIDLSRDGIARENKKIEEMKYSNVKTILGDICKMAVLPAVDRVFFSTSFHDFPCTEEIIGRFTSETRPLFTLIEFKKESEIGPPSEIKLSPEELDKIFNKMHYKREKIKFFEHHYIVNYYFDGNKN